MNGLGRACTYTQWNITHHNKEQKKKKKFQTVKEGNKNTHSKQNISEREKTNTT